MFVCASTTAGQQNPMLSLSQLCCGSLTAEAALSLGINQPSTRIRVPVFWSVHDHFKPARVGSHVKGTVP